MYFRSHPQTPHPSLLIGAALVVALGIQGPARAAEYSLQLATNLRTEFDDNRRLRTRGDDPTFATVVEASVPAAITTPLTELRLSSRVMVSRYPGKSELNNEVYLLQGLAVRNFEKAELMRSPPQQAPAASPRYGTSPVDKTVVVPKLPSESPPLQR